MRRPFANAAFFGFLVAIKPSPRFAVLLLLFHAIAAIAVYAAALPLYARLAIILLILLSLVYSTLAQFMARHYAQSKYRIGHIRGWLSFFRAGRKQNYCQPSLRRIAYQV